MRAEKLSIVFQSDQIIENAENKHETSSLSISPIFYGGRNNSRGSSSALAAK